MTIDKNKSIPYTAYPNFVVRTPVLPLVFLESLFSNDLHSEKIKEIIKMKEIQEALYIASPEFHEQLSQWTSGKEISLKELEKLFHTIYKYLSRMASRCTPFGLFAGCGTGIIGESTGVILKKKHERHTRLDMSYLCNLSIALSKMELIRNYILYYPNTSIYSSGDQLRYIEYRYRRASRTHHLVQIKNSRFVDKVFQISKKGATIKALRTSLFDEGIPELNANEFIDELIGNQILVSELDPTLTGDEFFHRMRKILKQISGIENINEILDQVNNKLNLIDREIDNNVSLYKEISAELDKLGIEYEKKFLFQADINLCTFESTISKDILTSIYEGINIFNKLTLKSTATKLDNFKENFNKRYETREMPLLQVLDPETGIGYIQNDSIEDDPLIGDILIPNKPEGSVNLKWNKVSEFLFKKFLEANAMNSYEVELSDKDLEPFESRWHDLPETFSSMINIIEKPNPKFQSGRILMTFAGGNGVQLLGRFCHGNNNIHEMVQEIVKQEQRLFPNQILAEIVHLPESRIGNISSRPALRDYEIPFLTNATVDSEHTITLDDLYISLVKNEIILRSKRLNQRIIPRLSNAHNYSNQALPVYQFLCDLQNQNLRNNFGFVIGSLEALFTFCPRIIYKNIILNSATWNLKKHDIEPLLKNMDSCVLLKEIAIWREKLRMPKMVVLQQADNALLINLESNLSIMTLLTTVKKDSSFILKEFLFNMDEAAVRNEAGAFTNEFVFTFCRNEKQ